MEETKSMMPEIHGKLESLHENLVNYKKYVEPIQKYATEHSQTENLKEYLEQIKNFSYNTYINTKEKVNNIDSLFRNEKVIGVDEKKSNLE